VFSVKRRREERATFSRKGTATRYQMREKLVAFGNDYYIKNEAGKNIFKVDGKEMVPGARYLWGRSCPRPG
jgi:hypothetical protein